MFSRSLRLRRIHGIEVRLSWSLPLFALLVLWAFAARYLADHGTTVAIVMGISGMVLFFGSILAHEFGHAIEARHRDLEVVGITLSMFGGVTEMHAEEQTARDELAVAAIGPYISLLCAAIFGLTATFAPDLLPTSVAVPVSEVAGLLGWINVALALFNLVPGAPLDGGRVLRALLWWLLSDRDRALVAAARIGQALWIAAIAGSVWLYQQSPELRPTALLMGFVSLFLYDAARREIGSARLERLYSGRTVADLVGPLPSDVPADRSLELLPPFEPAEVAGARFAVVTDNGSRDAILDLGDVGALHGTDRSVRTAADLARPVADLPVVQLDDDLHVLIERFQGDHSVVVIYDDSRPVGAITQRETARALGELRARGRVRQSSTRTTSSIEP